MERETKEKLIFLVICFILVFLIYGQTLFGDFVFDDRGIVDHQSLLQITHLPQVLTLPYWTKEAGLYRPITLVSYVFNYSFFGQEPWSFHLFNLIFYSLTGYLLFLLIKRIFFRRLLAYLASLLFLVLPIHTEAIANITGRSEILALFFSLLFFGELVKKEKINFWRSGLWFLLALGSKETAIAAAPIAGVIIFLKEFSGFRFKSEMIKFEMSEKIKKYLYFAISLMVSGLIYFSFRFLVLGKQYFLQVETSLVENPLKFAAPLERAATALKILAAVYLPKIFWPFGFCSDYSYNQIPVIHSIFNAGSVLGLVLILISAAVIFIFLKQAPSLSLGSAWFLFSFLPISNLFFPIGTIAGERLMYFPSVGLCLFLAEVLIFIPKIKPRRISGLFFLILSFSLIIFYSWRSFLRNFDWLDEKQLFISAAKCAPKSVLSHSNLGAVYYLEGNLIEAKKELLLAQQIYDGYPKGINNLGLVYWKEGDSQKARELFLRSLSFRFPYYGAYENLALMALEKGKDDEARDWLLKFYSGNSDLVELYIRSYLLSKRH